jgi:hypothetical protein
MNDLTELFQQIKIAQEPGAWTELDKNQGLAAVIVALRPKVVVEIGVWSGGSMIPQLLALKHLGQGVGIAIDAWSADASIEGQVDPANVEWWSHQTPHDDAFSKFCMRMDQFGVRDVCKVIRKRSDDVDMGELISTYGEIGLLSVDGNHGDAAVRDVQRFAPFVNIGGIMALDDVNWSGGYVQRARMHAIDKLGFRQLYKLGSHGGCFLQRVSY